MKKYTDELVMRYINADDIDEYSIDELEDDKKFMLLVIKKSKSNKFYHFCSDRVKKDYDLVRYLIKEFNNDINFLYNVADYYIENSTDEVGKLNVALMMLNFVKDEKNIKKYDRIVCAEYEKEIDKIYEYYDIQSSNPSLPEIYDGFSLILAKYGDNELFLNYCAKKFIERFCDFGTYKLDSKLHESFKSVEEFDKLGIEKCALMLIKKQDKALYNYVKSHKEVMKSLLDNLKIIRSDWNIYEKRIFNKLFDRIFMYSEFYESDDKSKQVSKDILMRRAELILYDVAKKLGIVEKVEKYYSNRTTVFKSSDEPNEYSKKYDFVVSEELKSDETEDDNSYDYEEDIIDYDEVFSVMTDDEINAYEDEKFVKSIKAIIFQTLYPERSQIKKNKEENFKVRG